VGYTLGGKAIDILPLDADDIAACEPVYETLPRLDRHHLPADQLGATCRPMPALPAAHAALIGVPIDMVSTGPDRVHTILLRHPFRLTPCPRPRGDLNAC
jgi:adenylosuccinate synthase